MEDPWPASPPALASKSTLEEPQGPGLQKASLGITYLSGAWVCRTFCQRMEEGTGKNMQAPLENPVGQEPALLSLTLTGG
jgi:hypothetical protein